MYLIREAVFGCSALAMGSDSTEPTTDVLGDTLVLDLLSLVWTNLTDLAEGVPPSPRAGHGFVTANNRLFVLGGYDGTWVSGAQI